MQDLFTGQTTRLRGRLLPRADERRALQDDHERRLAALARLGAAAAECGVGEDSDRDLFLLAEDEVALLEGAGGEWAALGERYLRENVKHGFGERQLAGLTRFYREAAELGLVSEYRAPRFYPVR